MQLQVVTRFTDEEGAWEVTHLLARVAKKGCQNLAAPAVSTGLFKLVLNAR